MSLLRVKTEASDNMNMMESSVQTPARSSSYTHHLFGLITPESPTSKAAEAQLVKKDYESPENAPKATLFRPWDTPESLSPSSDPISPASTLHTSPESNQHVVNLQNISPANQQYVSPNELQYASYSNLQHATSGNLQHISPSNLQFASQGNPQHISPANLQFISPTGLQHISPEARGSSAIYSSYYSPVSTYTHPNSAATGRQYVSPPYQYISPSGTYISPTIFPTKVPSFKDISPGLSHHHGSFTVPSSPGLPPAFDSSPSLHGNFSFKLQTGASYTSPPFSLETPLNLSSPSLVSNIRVSRKRKQEDMGASPCLSKRLKTEPDLVSSPVSSRQPPPASSPLGATKISPAATTIARGVAAAAVCGVCGEHSTGHHYGAPVCEGCKGFFRRRVIYRDVESLVCGRGGGCNLDGRRRIHCKLCRWQQCLNIGMNPFSVRSDSRTPGVRNTGGSFSDQILVLQKETMPAVPTVYLGRRHAANITACLAATLPASADLSQQAANKSLAFIFNLPDFKTLSADQELHLTTLGFVRVMLVRFLSRFRPEVNAFLFPSGEFVYPGSLDLEASLVGHLTTFAREMACNGLTELELGLLSVMAACDPMDPPAMYTAALEALTPSSSTAVMALLLQLEELFNLLPPYSWTKLNLKTSK